MVTGAGDGAAIENIAPVRSMRVDGPGAWRNSKFSTNRAETICIAANLASPVGRPSDRPSDRHGWLGDLGGRPRSELQLVEPHLGEAGPGQDLDDPPARIDLEPAVRQLGRGGRSVMVVVQPLSRG